VLDKVKEISWCDEVVLLSGFAKLDIELSHSAVDVDDTITQEFNFWILSLLSFFEAVHASTHLNRLCKAVAWNVAELDELLSYLQETIVTPVTEPINDTSVEQGW
jgi:hypothetical protein